MYILLLIAASILFAVGGLFMKFSNGLTRAAPGIGVFALFCAGAACQAIAMKRGEMSVVYLFVLGLEAVIAFLLGIVVLGERATVSKGCAVALIVAGIAWLERG
ncbi:MAG: DMT family transporter [Bryobacteraceae bacterium]